MTKFIFEIQKTISASLSLFFLLLFFASVEKVTAQDFTFLFCDKQVFSVGTLATDCWGWAAPDGTEYAIIGVKSGVTFVDLTNSEIVGFVEGPVDDCYGINWRDMTTYQHYCYVVSECHGVNEGLQVIDMQYLPDSVHLVGTFQVNETGGVTSHNLSIDTISGYAYLEGGIVEDPSIYIISLADPENPVYMGGFGPKTGIHDLYVMNDTLYVAGSMGFQLYEVANKFDPFYPKLITTVAPPDNGFLHNIWPTADGKYFATTEETVGKTVKIWDKRDINNIFVVSEYLAPNRFAHNVHIKDYKVYISHYESGVVILDISDPRNPVVQGIYDTYPDNDDSNGRGCWGTYPFSPSGDVYASDRNGKLFILEQVYFTPADTFYFDSAVASTGTSFKIDLSLKNTRSLSEINIPLDWSGGFDMILDSVSGSGLRADRFNYLFRNGSDVNNNRASYIFKTTNSSSYNDLPPGDGPILSLYFSIPFEQVGNSNEITIKTYAAPHPTEPLLVNKCITYQAEYLPGLVTLAEPCCLGNRGNLNGDAGDDVNIADLTYFVNFLFKNGQAPSCMEEANVNGEGTISDISDLTFFVNYFFKNGQEPAPCPAI